MEYDIKKLEIKEDEPLLAPMDIYPIFKRILADADKLEQDKEHFWTMGLTTRNTIKYIDLVSLGSLNANLVHPREVFRRAIHKGIAQLVIAHNHPSGNNEPSTQDIKMARRLTECGKLIGIDIIDHLIIANCCLSFKDKGII